MKLTHKLVTMHLRLPVSTLPHHTKDVIEKRVSVASLSNAIAIGSVWYIGISGDTTDGTKGVARYRSTLKTPTYHVVSRLCAVKWIQGQK